MTESRDNPILDYYTVFGSPCVFTRQSYGAHIIIGSKRISKCPTTHPVIDPTATTMIRVPPFAYYVMPWHGMTCQTDRPLHFFFLYVSKHLRPVREVSIYAQYCTAHVGALCRPLSVVWMIEWTVLGVYSIEFTLQYCTSTSTVLWEFGLIWNIMERTTPSLVARLLLLQCLDRYPYSGVSSTAKLDCLAVFFFVVVLEAQVVAEIVVFSE